MTALNKASIYNKLIEEINVRLRAGLPVQSSDMFWLNGVKKDAKKLMKVDAASAYIVLAILAVLEWDEKAARNHITCAENLEADSFVKSQKMALLVNLGYFTEAFQLVNEALSPELGMFPNFFNMLLGIGGFQKLEEFQQKAITMGIDLTGLPTEFVSEASHIMKSAHIPDERAVEFLNVAGSMLRERRMLTLKEPVISIDADPEHSPTVFVTFLVHVKPEVAADMTFELYEKLLDKFPDYPSNLNIGFRAGSLQ